MVYEIILIMFILLYALLAVCIVRSIMKGKGGSMREAKLKNGGFSRHQVRNLQKVSGNKKSYDMLFKLYYASNVDTRRGRVLNLKGEVLNQGYGVIDGGKK